MHGQLTQLVECHLDVVKVGGSSPSLPTKRNCRIFNSSFFYKVSSWFSKIQVRRYIINHYLRKVRRVMAKSSINTSKLAEAFLNNIDKLSNALNKHDEFEYSIIAIAMDGDNVIPVNLETMEQYGELFLVGVTFKSYWLTYVLTFGNSDFSIRSTFQLRREEELTFTYTEMFSVLNIEEFRDVDFSFVLDKDLIQNIMERVVLFAERYVGIFINSYKDNWVLLKKLQDQKKDWFYIENSRNKQFKTRRRFIAAYNFYISGDYKKAVKEYIKLKPWLTRYELMLLEYLNGIITGEKEDPRKEADYIPHNPHKLMRDMGKKSVVELLGFYIGWIPATALISIFFISAYYGFLFFHRDNIFMLISGVEMCFIPALFIGILAWLIPRKYFLKLVLKDKFESYMAVDTFYNSGFYRRTLPKLYAVIFTLSIVFMVLTLNWNIKFLKDRLLDNSAYFSITPHVIEYSAIKTIYKEENFRNGFNEVVDLPSYFILMKNDELLDLRILMYDLEGFEKVVLPYLTESIGIPLRSVDLKENILQD